MILIHIHLIGGNIQLIRQNIFLFGPVLTFEMIFYHWNEGESNDNGDSNKKFSLQVSLVFINWRWVAINDAALFYMICSHISVKQLFESSSYISIQQYKTMLSHWFTTAMIFRGENYSFLFWNYFLGYSSLRNSSELSWITAKVKCLLRENVTYQITNVMKYPMFLWQ